MSQMGPVVLPVKEAKRNLELLLGELEMAMLRTPSTLSWASLALMVCVLLVACCPTAPAATPTEEQPTALPSRTPAPTVRLTHTPTATAAGPTVKMVTEQAVAIGAGAEFEAADWVTHTLTSDVDLATLANVAHEQFPELNSSDTVKVAVLEGEGLQVTETKAGNGDTIVFFNGLPSDVGTELVEDQGKQFIAGGEVFDGNFQWSADHQAAMALSADGTFALLSPYTVKPSGLPDEARMAMVFMQDPDGNGQFVALWQDADGKLLAKVPVDLFVFRPDQGDEAGVVAEGKQVLWRFSKAIEGQEPLVTSFELYLTPDVTIELSPLTVTADDIKNIFAGREFKPDEVNRAELGNLFYTLETGEGKSAEVILSQPALDALRAATGLSLTDPATIAAALAANDTSFRQLINYALQNKLLPPYDKYRQRRMIAMNDLANNPTLFIIESSIHANVFTPALKSIPKVIHIGPDGKIIEKDIDLTLPESRVPLTLRLSPEGQLRWDNDYEGIAYITYLDGEYTTELYEPLARPLVYESQELLSFVYDYVGNHNNHTISGDSLTFDQKELTSQLIYPANPPLFIPVGDGKNSFSHKQADEILGYLAFAYEHSAYLREILPLARPHFIVKSPMKRGLFLSPAYYPNGVTGIRINTVNIEDRAPDDPASVFKWRENAGPPGGLKGKMVAALFHEIARCQTHHAEMDSGPKGVIYQRDLEWRLIQSILPSLSQEDKDGAKYDFEFSHGIPFDDYTPSN
jgi:hypothetical protein